MVADTLIITKSIKESIHNVDVGLDSISFELQCCNASLQSLVDSVNVPTQITTDLHRYVEHSINGSSWDKWIDILQFTIPALVTVVMFFLGYRLNSRNEQKRSEIEIKRNQEKKLASMKADCLAIKQYVNALKGPIDNLCSHINEFTQKLKTSRDVQLEAFTLSDISVDCLAQYDSRILTKLYLTNRKGKIEDKAINLYHVISKIEFLSKVTDILTEHYSEYKEHSISNMKQWNDVYEKVIAYVSDLDFRKRNGNMFDEMYKYLEQCNIVNNHIEAKELTDNVYKKYLNWLITNSYYQNNGDAKIIGDLLNKGIFIYDGLKTTCFLGYAQIFEEVAQSMNRAYDDLVKCLNRLDSNNFVDPKDIE
ncbi:MAG: hypothetical protein E7069_02420 [Bacteroidales bacterium]|jgi:hypothetical protein|nr:hypothetical protein [Bacteroidales bacterium]